MARDDRDRFLKELEAAITLGVEKKWWLTNATGQKMSLHIKPID